MNKYRTWVALFALAAVAITGYFAYTAPGGSSTATVTAVVDGDTIDIRDQSGDHRVRIIGIDTPEIGRNGALDECYAQEARAALDALAYGKAVELRADPTQDDTDRYGRLLRHVYVDGESAAVTLLEQGLGREYTYDSPYQGYASHLRAETRARAVGAGLWGADCAD